MKELNVVEVEAVSGGLDIAYGFYVGVTTYMETQKVLYSIQAGVEAAFSK